MRKTISRLATLLFLGAIPAFSQPSPFPQIIYVSNDVTGVSCGSTSIALRTTTGVIYTCQSGAYAAVSGGGGGNSVQGASNLVTAGKPTAVSASGTITQAVAANITGLWGGTCNSTTVLGGDGNCQSQTGYVLGGGNLTTTGAVPFQSGVTGTLTQDSGFTYDVSQSLTVPQFMVSGSSSHGGGFFLKNQTPATRALMGFNNSIAGHYIGSTGEFGAVSASGDPTSGNADTSISNCGAGCWAFGTGSVGSKTGSANITAIGIVAVLTASLKSCTAGGATPTGIVSYEQAVSDATAPALGVALTGGGTVWAKVHCSLTTGTYIVDGL